MIGMERNSDIVFAASYAPLLGVSLSFGSRCESAYSCMLLARRWFTMGMYRLLIPTPHPQSNLIHQTPNLIAFE